MPKTFSLILSILFCGVIHGQEITVDQYIEKYSGIAIQEMKKYHIPASITLAQGILESGCGNSELAKKANNHFGIKCHNDWNGKTFHMDDDSKHECFRKYDHPEDSYKDHSLFLATRDRYSSLFKLDIRDYKSWAYGLKQAGYATNPRYPELLIRIIEENKLNRLDNGSRLNQTPVARNEEPVLDLEGENTELEGLLKSIGKGGHNREIFTNNGVKCILAKQGDTWYDIAKEFGIYGWQVRKYNGIKKDYKIEKGEVVYLEKKKKKASVEFYRVQSGDDMRNISQRFAVKLKALYRRNGLEMGTEPAQGTILKLK